MAAATAFVRETRLLGARSLRRTFRVPANLISTILFPLIQLFVFSQLFKDIVSLPGFGGGGSYLAYLVPGQIAFTVFFAVAWVGGNILVDLRNGYLDKLRVAPINRYAVLAGEVVPLFIEAVIMGGAILALSVVMGARVETGLPGAALILVLAGLFGVVWSATSFLPALITKNEQATGTLALLFMPLAFMSTAFVPVSLMPDWLQVLNDWNPISHLIEAMRTLMTSGYDWALIGRAVLSLAVLGTVLHGATFWAFRRLTA
jgi:ABC-2 type transport system permease protein